MRPTGPSVSRIMVSAVMSVPLVIGSGKSFAVMPDLLWRQRVADGNRAIAAKNFNCQALAFTQIGSFVRLGGPAKLRKRRAVKILDSRFGNVAARIGDHDASGRVVKGNPGIGHADQAR